MNGYLRYTSLEQIVLTVGLGDWSCFKGVRFDGHPDGQRATGKSNTRDAVHREENPHDPHGYLSDIHREV